MSIFLQPIGRMTRHIQEAGIDLERMSEPFQTANEWIPQLLEYSGTIQGIMNDPDRSQQGKRKSCDAVKEQWLKKLADKETVFEAIAAGKKAIEGGMINSTAIARGVNKVVDPIQAIVDAFMAQEIRQLSIRQADIDVQAHRTDVDAKRKAGIPVTDGELQPPETLARIFYDACVAANSAIINAFEKSPIPLLDPQTLANGEQLLRQAVCPDKLEQLALADCRAECLRILFQSVENMIRDPKQIKTDDRPAWKPPVSDEQRREAAAAA